MSLRLLIPILGFVLWSFVCQQWYVCKIKQVCDKPAATAPAPEVKTETPDTRPLVFNWAAPDAITRPGFAAFRDSLLATIPEGGTLEIIGLYAEGEPAPEGFPNMGLARAAKVKALFAGHLPDDRISISSQLADKPADAETKPFESVRFSAFNPEAEEKTEIVEVPDRIIIHFPYSSAQKEADPKVDEFLKKMAERLKQTDETVTITGHTDNTGTDQANLVLGRARARHIQKILIGYGVDKSRITIESKGESEPIADNDTEAGRHRNRRAEIVLHAKN
ncbi:MAG: OmpA family protein [Bacteroidetes bacterium]|nr:MAG: OmpA family protein [Bacteroidota bacterium]